MSLLIFSVNRKCTVFTIRFYVEEVSEKAIFRSQYITKIYIVNVNCLLK